MMRRLLLLTVLLLGIYSVSIHSAAPALAQASPALLVNPITGSLREGRSRLVTVRLATQPTADVVVLLSSNYSYCQSMGEATLTTSNWQTGVSIAVSYPQDSYATTDGQCEINAYVTRSTAAEYPGGMSSAPQLLSFVNNDVARLVLSNRRFNFAPGEFRNYRVQLAASPNPGVTVQVFIEPNSHCRVNKTQLVFNSTNYATPQTVRVRALNHPGTRCVVRHTVFATSGPYDGLTAPAVVGEIN